MKSQTRWLLPVFLMFMVCVLVPDRVWANVKYLTDTNVFPMRTANTIYVAVQTSTWKDARQVFVGCSSGHSSQIDCGGFRNRAGKRLNRMR